MEWDGGGKEIDAMVAVNTIRPRDGQGSHARGPPDQSDFPAEGEGTESPEMSGGLQNRRNTIERPPGKKSWEWTWL